jgi:catalase
VNGSKAEEVMGIDADANETGRAKPRDLRGRSGEAPAALGSGWTDRPETADSRRSVAGRVVAQQREIAAGRADLADRADRGQHQKQVLGAFGTIRIDEAIPSDAKHGPFAKARAYKVACRISNGQPCPHHDRLPDVRGVAIKFFSWDGTETDLLMTNQGGRSHARNAVQFMAVADLLGALQAQGGKVEALRKLVRGLYERTLGPMEAARVATILAKETVFRTVHTMTTESFWGSVVRLGPNAAVKYSIHPHRSTRPGTRADRRRPNYLREDLLARLTEGSIRYDLAVQFFVHEARTPINDASVAWRAPIVRVGELEIAGRPALEHEVLVGRMAFNPGNGFDALGITHARKLAYAASAKSRGALTTEDIRGHFT